MIECDEDALICDLAETYNIYDYRSLPVKLVATLSAGLRDDSRIKLALAGAPVPQEIILMAGIADRIEAIRYMLSDNKTSAPTSIVETIMSGEKKKKGVVGFKSGADLEAALARIKGE